MRHANLHPAACLLATLVLTAAGDPLLDFHARVERYVHLHRTLARDILPRQVTSDPAQWLGGSDALADAITVARSNARQGDIFTPAVTRVFRERLARALAGHDVDRLLADLHEGEDFRQLRAAVHARDPHCRVPLGLPPALLWALPALPGEVQYRVVGRDLALWDEHARMIVDFIPNAFPEQSFAHLITFDQWRAICF